ncbi:hypothetical protein HPB49_006335 [Dermacentor silvarum]|uniref:Uncharacterized protein n=1 Tax=Dermacentor silvarum TaxID=543639 RepID=A0ACB8DWL2_DERSI|nr:hypothetical protein HPB49_006335 [Dermacentor silvarum]
MSIKKACELDLSSGRLIRFVDVGNGQEPHDADNIPLATQALVFMVVGLAAPWKMPFGYFLNAGLSGEVIKNLLLEAVHCIQECGLKVTAIVCDCLMANVAMVKLLWCRVHELTFENLRTSFPNPQDEQEEIFVMFDACHALKLLRNLLGDKNILLSETYGEAAQTAPQQAHHEADTALPPLPDDATTPDPPPPDGQELQLPASDNDHPQTQAEESSVSPPTLRRSQRARKPQDRYASRDFRH